MTLDEAFEKYDDSVLMKRPSSRYPLASSIEWLKQLKSWGNEEANGDDWEVVNSNYNATKQTIDASKFSMEKWNDYFKDNDGSIKEMPILPDMNNHE